MFKKMSIAILLASSFLLTGCIEDQVFKAIENNPEKFFEAVKKAEGKYKEVLAKKQEQESEKALEEEFKNPKKAEIDEDRVIFGSAEAPITIVEYSDFQCPFCSRGYDTVKKVMEEYGDKVRVVYKHLPLDFHPLAMPAAQYFEAIALQSHEKAEKFHDIMFEQQDRMKSEGEDFLKAAAKEVGADMSKLKKDMKSEEVMNRVKSDMEEAQKFGFSGTPGFLVNGVSVKGAYPFDHFKMIIDKHLAE
ncbi:MAG: thioredoxin domain-containing protein [Bdellovibrionales bacterium]|nr:thioredoxin domain-containing protein [Bdellovibrionales bacterium]